MKTLKFALFTAILFSSFLSSCRESEEMLTNENVVTEEQFNFIKNEQKDPPTDPPKDRDNWKTNEVIKL